MAKQLRGAEYIRMSTDKQDESPQEQRDEIKRAILDVRDDIEQTVEYIDEGISGDSDLSRPGFMRMLADAEAGKFDVILCYDQDRFSRQDPADSGTQISRLKRANVRLITVANGEYNFKDLMDQARYMMAQLGKAQFLRDASRNQKRSQNARSAAGKFVGSQPAYGYVTDAERFLIPGPAWQVKIVRECFDRYAAGWSSAELIESLNQRQIKTTRGSHWTVQSVLSLLKNRVYIGWLVTDKSCGSKYISDTVADHLATSGRKKYMARNPPELWKFKKKNHQAIVDKKLFDKVQELIARNRKRGTGPKTNRYAFSGLLKCEQCGSAMSGCYNVDSRTKKPGSRYYKCCQSRGKCPAGNVKESELLTVIIGQIRDHLERETSPDRVARIAAEMKRQAKAATSGGDTDRLAADHKNELYRLETLIHNMNEMQLTGRAAKMQGDQIAATEIRLSELEAELESAAQPVGDKVDELGRQVLEAKTWIGDLASLTGRNITDPIRVDICRALAQVIDHVSIDVQAIKPAPARNRFRLTGGTIYTKAQQIAGNNSYGWVCLNLGTTANEEAAAAAVLLRFDLSV